MKIKILLILMLIIALPLMAQTEFNYGFDFNKAGTAGLQFLKIGIGARESAMGEAALGVSKGANSIFWNPAGIAHIDHAEATFSHATWLLDIDINAFAAVYNLKNRITVGISAIYMGIPDFEETTVTMQDGTGRMVSANDIAIGLAVARRFTNKLAMGGQIRYVREQLDQDSFQNVLVDIGAIYFTGFRHLTLAVSAQHFGPDIRFLRDKFRMPLIFKVGVADDIFHSDFSQLTLAVDLLHPTDNNERVNFGLEWGLMNLIYFRGGYRMGADLGNYSFGAGIKQKILGVAGQLDYSFSEYGEIMGGVNRITATFGF
ncbi:MAG: PorV/PorQ family protein [Calditrichaeota bacterium]|nr:PorV/PorQ family protein [Calditrichota bacterium]